MAKVDLDQKEIEDALNNGELCFYYQPKISFLTGEIVGGEALLRWLKPDGSVVPPGDFIPMCEMSGFITDITAVMVSELVEDIVAIRTAKTDIQIAFNVSALDLISPYLVKMLRSFIVGHRIDSGNIQIEITETAVVDSSDRINKSLFDMVALGIELVMDDFGTGYSSLDVLSRLPFSALKLDQGVVRRMASDARNTHIVRSSLFMARELSIKTIAEGVETEAAYNFLMAAGCTEVQGYWVSRPIPRDEFIELCKAKPRWPSSSLGKLYNNAWVNHMSYRRKVLDAVYTLSLTKPDEWDQLPKMDLGHSPARCQLGRWYSGEGRKGRRAADVMRLEEPHRLMHEAGAELIETAKKCGGDPKTVMKAIKAFMELSNSVDSEVARIVERSFGKVLRKDNK